MTQPVDIRVISLAHATHRGKQTQQQLDATGLDWRFIDAIDGKSLNAEDVYDRSARLRQKGYDLSSGEIACFLSHRIGWKHSVESGRPCLIMEDDFLIDGDFSRALDIADRHRDCYDLLRFHGHSQRRQKTVKSVPGFDLVKYYKDPNAALAYVVTPAGAGTLLKHSQRFHLTVDNFMGETWLHRLRIRGLSPYPITESEAHAQTTIVDRRDLRLPFRSRFLTEIHRIPRGVRASLYRWWAFYHET